MAAVGSSISPRPPFLPGIAGIRKPKFLLAPLQEKIPKSSFFGRTFAKKSEASKFWWLLLGKNLEPPEQKLALLNG